jgi:DNA-binding PadR family transcriptional regulator
MHRFRFQHRDREYGHSHFGPFGGLGAQHGRHSHGRRARVFEQGDLRYVILHLIGEKPSHGYELIKAIEERLGGAYSPSPGVIYPTLTLLEELGHVAAVPAEGAKKAFEITPAGRTALEANKSAVEAIFARMDAVAERSAGGTAPQIIRAMENLRTALRLRIDRGRPSDEVVARIAQALDGAAQAVEAA